MDDINNDKKRKIDQSRNDVVDSLIKDITERVLGVVNSSSAFDVLKGNVVVVPPCVRVAI